MPLSVEEARLEAWQRGDLRYKLRPYQDSLHAAVWRAIRDPKCLKFCVNCNRRHGKTFVLGVAVSEFAQKTPNARIRFAAPNLDELRERVNPIMEQIHADCPEELRPKWYGYRKAWVWPNGATMYVAGVNNQGHNKLRGAGCELGVIDEGGFIEQVDKLVGDVMLPQTLDAGGTLIGTSTPPESAAHQFVDFYKECRDAGNLYSADVYSMGLEQWKIDLYAQEAGGYGSVRWRREWLAEYVTDEELQVIPEWDDKWIMVAVPDEYSRYWHRYNGMDLGATRRDFTANLIGHYNFLHRAVYIERELIDKNLPRMKSDALAAAIVGMERGLWGDEYRHPKRWSDNNNVELLMELALDKVNPLAFSPTSKDELPAMVNKLRVWVKQGRVRIDPSCTNLIDCLREGTWKGHDWIGREFDRTTKLGHLDALAALIYLVRNIEEEVNPVPKSHGFDPRTQSLPRGGFGPGDNNLAALRSAFGPKKGML